MNIDYEGKKDYCIARRTINDIPAWMTFANNRPETVFVAEWRSKTICHSVDDDRSRLEGLGVSAQQPEQVK